MGGGKRMMEDEDHKRQVALQIALDAGVLEVCDLHEDSILEGSEDIEQAYRLGNSKFSSGKLNDLFKNRTEMTDYIKDAVESNSSDECYFCRKIREE